jgi:hypothetical protein
LRKRETDFKIPPISPLAGSTLANFFKVLTLGKVSFSVIPRLALTLLIILISTPFQIYEYFFYRNTVRNYKFKKPPIFIIGHWRSGTTHLHNLLSKDPENGFSTTYQAVFPNNLRSKWIFKTFMKLNMPEKRPSDNVKLSTNFPQEDEYALSNMTHMSFYHYFYYPSVNDMLYEKYVRNQGISPNEKNKLKENYHELLVKAVLNTQRDQLVSKNPLNTGRIKLLLEMYPDAKFIHIYRNPIVTYLSSVKFFKSLLATTSLEEYEDEFVVEKVIENFKKLMGDFIETKSLIPEGNLYEVKFEEFDQDNLAFLEDIYKKLDLASWDLAEPHFQEYIQAQKSYRKNTYKITRSELDLLLKEWGFAMKELNYAIPENLEVF